MLDFIKQTKFQQMQIFLSYLLAFSFILTILILAVTPDNILTGYSAAELGVESITKNLPDIHQNFLYYPYYLAVFLIRALTGPEIDGVIIARIISTGLGFIIALSSFVILRKFYNTYLALLGAVILVSNSWLLHLTKVGLPEISGLAALLVLIALLAYFNQYSRKLSYRISLSLAVIVNWFSPAMPWLVIALMVYGWVRRKHYLTEFGFRLKNWLIVMTVILAMIMIVFTSQNGQNLTAMLGMPDQAISPLEAARNLLETLQALFSTAPYNPGLWLNRLPLLDVFGVALIPLGIYNLSVDKPRYLTSFAVIFTAFILLMASLNGGVESAIFFFILPAVIFFIILGVRQLAKIWFDLFPLNPLPHLIGITLILSLVGLTTFYQTKKYFVAFRQNQETRQIYNLPINETDI